MNGLTRFSLYPIGRLAKGPPSGFDDDDFNLSLLPIEVVEDVYIEDVSSLIRKGDFDTCKQAIGEHRLRELESIKYAIVHRYPQHGPDPDTAQYLDNSDKTQRSRKLINEIAACLRIIRPITTRAQFCEGKVSDDGKLYDIVFNEPIPNFSLPINQRHFSLRNSDADDLCFYAPLFIAAMAGMYWKFRMAVQMYDTGYFQHEHWKIRFFLWTSALEALFTSQNREHTGSLVAKERIKDHLGANSSIYPHGEIVLSLANPNLSVAAIVGEIYCLRNHIAHGDKVPDYYFQATGRADFNGSLQRKDMLTEAVSFIVRQSLLKIMKDNMLSHFQDSSSSEMYFSARRLTKTDIRGRPEKTSYSCPP